MKPVVLCLLLLGALQIAAGFASLSWAWPLFGDPPFMQGGVMRTYGDVRMLMPDDASATKVLSSLRFKLEYLYSRHAEGVLVGLALGAALLAFGAATLVVAGRAARTIGT